MRTGRIAGFVLSAAVLGGLLWLARDMPLQGTPIRDVSMGELSEEPSVAVSALAERSPRLEHVALTGDGFGGRDAARRLRILVEDALGAAVVSATIDGLGVGAAQRSLGRTASDGIAEVDIGDDAHFLEFMVRARGYETAFVPVPAAGVDGLRVRLEFGGRISGTVHGPDGVPVGADLMVLAVPLGYLDAGVPTTEQIARCVHGLSTSTLHDGSFRIEGLREGSPYRLEVGSEGYSARHADRNTLVTASVDGVRLQVCELYGALVEFSCADPLALGPNFSPPPGSTRQRGQRAFERLPFWGGSVGIRHANPILAGVGAHSLPLLFARTDAGGAEVHSVEFRCTIPGFAPVAESIEIRALRLGALPVQRIELQPTAEGFGSVEVELEGPGVELLARMRLQGFLRLSSEGGGPRLSFPLTWDPDYGGSAVAAHVPAGTYRWALSLGTGWLEVGDVPGSAAAPDSVEVRIADVTRIEARVPGLSFLEITCSGSPGAAGAELVLARGPHFTRGWAEELETFVCGEGTRILGPFAPGHYELGAQPPRELVGGPLVLVLEPGQLRSEVLVLR